MFSELLPIGSVVTLEGGVKKVMITGIKPVKETEPDVVYDYIGVPYPEGYLSSAYQVLFDHSDINDVVFMGYSNPERERFIAFLQETQGK